jgi:hypothetical protein
MISGDREYTSDGLQATRDPRIQLDAWGTLYAQAKGIVDAIIAGLSVPETNDGIAFEPVRFEGERDGLEQLETTKVFRRGIDLIVWHAPGLKEAINDHCCNDRPREHFQARRCLRCADVARRSCRDPRSQRLDGSHRRDHMGTTGFRDFIQSPLRDGEEADIVMNWIPNSATDTLCIAAIGATRAFELVVPAGAGHTYKFTGSVLVRNYVRNNPMDDKRTATLTVKWVSAITETYV